MVKVAAGVKNTGFLAPVHKVSSKAPNQQNHLPRSPSVSNCFHGQADLPILSKNYQLDTTILFVNGRCLVTLYAYRFNVNNRLCHNSALQPDPYTSLRSRPTDHCAIVECTRNSNNSKLCPCHMSFWTYRRRRNRNGHCTRHLLGRSQALFALTYSNG